MVEGVRLPRCCRLTFAGECALRTRREDENMTRSILGAVVLAATSWTLGVGVAGAGPSTAGATLPYPLDYCVVSGDALGTMGKPVSVEFEGREIRFCCDSCVKKFKADPQSYLKLIDEAVMKAQRPLYPLGTCVVDGKPLGETPVEFLHQYTLVRVDRDACRQALEADPKKPLAALDAAAIAKQRPTYPLDTCVVTGEKLGGMGDPVDYVYRGRLVRFCCSGCIRTFEKDPASYLKRIAAANPGPGAAPSPPVKG
jgi:YHS domain-containing protein